jgi:hypothetical protein
MSDPIASMSPEEFATLLPARIFTDGEIAHWIRSNPLGGSQKVQVLQAIVALHGGGPVTGVIRTALREMDGLPPVPGDAV